MRILTLLVWAVCAFAEEEDDKDKRSLGYSLGINHLSSTAQHHYFNDYNTGKAVHSKVIIPYSPPQEKKAPLPGQNIQVVPPPYIVPEKEMYNVPYQVKNAGQFEKPVPVENPVFFDKGASFPVQKPAPVVKYVLVRPYPVYVPVHYPKIPQHYRDQQVEKMPAQNKEQFLQKPAMPYYRENLYHYTEQVAEKPGSHEQFMVHQVDKPTLQYTEQPIERPAFSGQYREQPAQKLAIPIQYRQQVQKTEEKKVPVAVQELVPVKVDGPLRQRQESGRTFNYFRDYFSGIASGYKQESPQAEALSEAFLTYAVQGQNPENSYIGGAAQGVSYGSQDQDNYKEIIKQWYSKPHGATQESSYVNSGVRTNEPEGDSKDFLKQWAIKYAAQNGPSSNQGSENSYLSYGLHSSERLPSPSESSVANKDYLKQWVLKYPVADKSHPYQKPEAQESSQTQDGINGYIRQWLPIYTPQAAIPNYAPGGAHVNPQIRGKDYLRQLPVYQKQPEHPGAQGQPEVRKEYLQQSQAQKIALQQAQPQTEQRPGEGYTGSGYLPRPQEVSGQGQIAGGLSREALKQWITALRRDQRHFTKRSSKYKGTAQTVRKSS